MSTTKRSPSALGLSALGQRTEAPPIAWLMEYALAHPEVISLAAGFTDNPSLPVVETNVLLRRILGRRKTGEPSLQYGTTAGSGELRELTASRVLAMDRAALGGESSDARDAELIETAYGADRAVMTSGSQQLLYMLTEILCDPGDIVIVEDPTYFVYLGITQSHGLDCRGAPTRGDGIDTDRLEQLLEKLKRSGEISRLKMVYLVTYHQNPSGRTTSLRRKAEVVRLLRRYEKAAGHRIYLLEDAA